MMFFLNSFLKIEEGTSETVGSAERFNGEELPTQTGEKMNSICNSLLFSSVHGKIRQSLFCLNFLSIF